MREDKRKTWFIVVLSGVFLVMLILNLLTPLVADDYMYSFSFATSERIGSLGDIFPSLAAHARQMNGRLTPHFFVQLFSMLPRAAFGVVNALVYMAFLSGVYRLARGDERYDVRLLCVIAGAVFLLPPAFGQSFLWMAGSVNYLWCDTLMVCLLIPFSDAVLRGRDRPGVFTRVLLCACALIFGNMSENVSAAAALLMGLCVCYLLARGRRVRAWMIALPLLTLAGWLLLMLSPANRGSVARSAGGIGALIRNFEAASAMFMSHGLWLSIVFLALFCLSKSAGANDNRLALSMGLFVCALLCNFSMTGSDYYPERAWTGACLMLIIACALLLAELPRRCLPLGDALAVCLAFAMAMTAVNALPNTYDLYDKAQQRAAQVSARLGEGERDAVTFGIAGRTKYDAFYGMNELTIERAYFPNVYYAKYYGLDSIVIDRME